MITSKKVLLALVASSFALTTFPMESETPAEPVIENMESETPAASAEEKSFAIRSIDFVTNKLGHIKKCLQGKETCSKADFAILAASFVFLRSMLWGFLNSTETTIRKGYPTFSTTVNRLTPIGSAGYAGGKLGAKAGKFLGGAIK